MKRALDFAAFEARSPVIIISIEKSGIQFDGSFERQSRIRVAPFHRESLAGCDMGFCQMRIQLQRPGARLASFLQMRLVIATIKMHVRACQPRPRSCEIWINGNGTLKHFAAKPYVLAGPFLEE